MKYFSIGDRYFSNGTVLEYFQTYNAPCPPLTFKCIYNGITMYSHSETALSARIAEKIKDAK